MYHIELRPCMLFIVSCITVSILKTKIDAHNFRSNPEGRKNIRIVSVEFAGICMSLK